MITTKVVAPLPLDKACADVELEGNELDYLVKMGVAACWYWYRSNDYDGYGHVIYKLDDKFYHHDLDHCSCYGPLDEVKATRPFDTVADLLDSCSAELREELKTIVEAIR